MLRVNGQDSSIKRESKTSHFGFDKGRNSRNTASNRRLTNHATLTRLSNIGSQKLNVCDSTATSFHKEREPHVTIDTKPKNEDPISCFENASIQDRCMTTN